jgi:hypothetical protein
MTQLNSTATSSLLPPRYGQRGRRLAFLDPSKENALPEVGQDKILDLLGSLTGRSLGFGAALAPRAEQTLLELLDSMDPLQDRARGAASAQSILGSAREQGRAASASLARRGFGAAVQAGAELDALNRGASRAQDSLLSLLSPESRQRRGMSLYQMMSALQTPQILSARMQGYGQEGQRRLIDRQTEGQGFLGGLLDILGVAGSYGLGGDR